MTTLVAILVVTGVMVFLSKIGRSSSRQGPSGPRMVACARCGGAGKLSEAAQHNQTCFDCGGTGRVQR